MQFVVFTGLPGTGKSSTAEAVARALTIPVLASGEKHRGGAALSAP